MIRRTEALALDGRPVIEIFHSHLEAGRWALRGTASVYEATMLVELMREGTVLEIRHVSAAVGAPERGDWDFDVGLDEAVDELCFIDSAAEVAAGDLIRMHSLSVPFPGTP